MLRSCLAGVGADGVPVLKKLRIFPDTQRRLVRISTQNAISPKAAFELPESFLVTQDAASKLMYHYYYHAFN